MQPGQWVNNSLSLLPTSFFDTEFKHKLNRLETQSTFGTLEICLWEKILSISAAFIFHVLALGSYVMTLSAAAFVLSLLIPVIAVDVPQCLCLLPQILSPFQQIPIAQVTSLGCLNCTRWYSQNRSSEDCRARWSKLCSHAVAPSTAGGISPAM